MGDIPNVSHVVNFELPLLVDERVHRCGRVGRIGKKGIAVTMVTGRESIFKPMRRTLLDQNTELPEWCNLREMALPRKHIEAQIASNYTNFEDEKDVAKLYE